MGRVEDFIIDDMNRWGHDNYATTMQRFAKDCGCKMKYIKPRVLDPYSDPGYDPGFLFFGPGNNLIGEIRWDNRGRKTQLYEYVDKVNEVRKIVCLNKAEMARKKSVNRTREQEMQRKVSLKDAVKDFASRYVKEIVAVGLIVTMLLSGNAMLEKIKNPPYETEDYKTGMVALYDYTHRTDDNEGYWYDYRGIAGSYDIATDFDEFIYGIYRHIGWNQNSRVDCMDEIFTQLNFQGVTGYDDFTDYLRGKGYTEYNRKGEEKLKLDEYSKDMEEKLTLKNEELKNESMHK